jgi:fructose 5-dehydrogenase cytochrome subunit
LRTLHSFALVCVFSAATAALLPACSSSDDPGPSGGAGAPAQAGSSGSAAGKSSAGGSPSTAGDPAKGAIVWAKPAVGCASCHAESAAGQYGPNITFSKTAGIGNWTLAQFTAGVREGKDTDGTLLCDSMTRFSASVISDTDMADLYAYIGTKPISDVKEQGIFCP